MYTHTTNRSMLLLAALSCCLIATNAALADGPSNKSRTTIVNCNQGGASVQSAIDEAQYGRDTTIFIVGFCDERVSIVKDGITLSGNKDGNGLIGNGLTEVTITGAQRVRIEYLDITGAGYGVLAQEGASVTISNNNIHHNKSDGVGAWHNVFVRVELNSITSNGLLEPDDGAGIEGGAGATIRSRGNYIADNGWAAIAFGQGGALRLGINSSDPADRDIILQKGCSEGAPLGCGDPETIAVYCYRYVLCEIRSTDVTGDISITGMSNFEVRNSTINGDIAISSLSNFSGDNSVINAYIINVLGGSRLGLRNNVVGSGWVYCNSASFADVEPYYIQCGDSIPSPDL